MEEQDTKSAKVLVKGLPASPGMGYGKVHVIKDPSDIDEFKDGEILVTEMTAPDWVPAMKKAQAIVTDSGGMTCHASIVSRELGIPCIVGTKSRGTAATSLLHTGDEITVDASNGVVFAGNLQVKKAAAAAAPQTQIVAQETFPVTGTKIYMNLGDPALAENTAACPATASGSCGKNSSGPPTSMNIPCI